MATPFYYPTIGGTESIVENIAICLNRIGVQTDIMTLNPAWQPSWRRRTEVINGLRIMRIPALYLKPKILHHNKISFMIDYLPGDFKALLKYYDIIHFHNDVNLCFPFFSYSITKPKIFHCHCLNMTYQLYKRNFVSRYLFAKTAGMYVAVSNWLAGLLQNLDIPSHRIRVVHNGIDIAKFHPQSGIKSSDTVLFVGRITPVKGLLTVLKSLCYLKKHIDLVVIGPMYDSQYAKKITESARTVAAKTGHSITFIGVQTQEELIRWYQKASILVLPSLSEPFGIVGLEALSCETPVVASSVGGIPEFVQNEKNGMLVPPGDPIKMAEGIQYLLDNERIRVSLGEEGRRSVMAKFSSEKMTKKLLHLYEEIVCDH